MTNVQYQSDHIDGLDIFYREAGSKDAPVLLLLHGFPTSSHMFRNLIPKLASKYRVIAPDLPGFGYSSAPDHDKFNYSFEHFSIVVEQLLDRLVIHDFYMYVMDYGAPTGFRIAARNPERIKGLIIQNGNAYDEGLADFWVPIKEYWNDPSNKQKREALRWLTSNDATKWQYTHGIKQTNLVSPDTYTFDQQLLDRTGNQEIQLDLFLDYGTNPPLYPEWQAYFRKYQPPTLIVWGKGDEIFPVSGAYPYLRDLPNAELHILEDAGHFALETHLEQIAGLMESFIDKNVGVKKLIPPFTLETAKAKVKAAEDAWNSRDPERVVLAYTIDSEWRNRTEFFKGREKIKEFLRRKWAKELDYRLMKELWAFTDNRISVRFEYEWRDAETGQWMRTHGNEHWEFDDAGLMRRRDMSANDYPIDEKERKYK